VKYYSIFSYFVTNFVVSKAGSGSESKRFGSITHEIWHDFMLNEFSDVEYRNLVGLGFDGAAAMAGHLCGAQTLFRADLPHVYYVHCFCHRLSLVLAHSTKVN
jgi:hypothetical protein